VRTSTIASLIEYCCCSTLDRNAALEIPRSAKIVCTFLFLLVLLTPGRCNAQVRPSSTAAAIYERNHESVVVIIVSDKETNPLAQGSGFIAAQDRIVTNHHVLEEASNAIVIFADGSASAVEGVVADSPTMDLAILAVKTGARAALRIGDELSVRQGDPVYALGAPHGLELSLTNGIVSGFRRLDKQFMIQTTAAIAPGSSGGPLFDQEGRVIGVTTSLINESPGIYFSIGSGDVSRLLRTPAPAVMPMPGRTNESTAGQRQNSLPVLTGSYNGTVHNTTGNVEATFSIVIVEDENHLRGCVIVHPPLYGSGPLLGTRDAEGDIRFDVTSGIYQIAFRGRVETQKIAGTYRVARPSPQDGYFELHRDSSKPSSVGPDLGTCETDRQER
jgi:S1-C subfamily serine protease